MKNAALMAGTAVLTGGGLLGLMKIGPNSIDADAPEEEANSAASEIGSVAKNGKWDPGEELTSYKDVASYNNFYEYGVDKSDPAANASTLRPRPWTIAVEGECAKPQVIDIDQILKWFPLEERVYRMRCVEAWSMVIPWVGFSLGELVKKLEPTSKAKYVTQPVVYGCVAAVLLGTRIVVAARKKKKG